METDMTVPAAVREEIIGKLQQDLVGPLAIGEILEGEKIRPSDVYLTGILWPLGERMGAEDDDGSEGDDENDESPSTATVVGQQRPCAMGVSLATESTLPEHGVSIAVRFATYAHSSGTGTGGPTLHRWERTQHEFILNDVSLPDGGDFPKTLAIAGLGATIEVHVRSIPAKGSLLSTFTLINRSQMEEPDRDALEGLTLFQTEIEVSPGPGTRIVPRPPLPTALDEDERSGRLLYRDCHEFAAGHQCSVDWKAVGNTASLVKSTWIPRVLVPAYREDGDEVFSALIDAGTLVADNLAQAEDEVLCQHLDSIPEAYGQWILERLKDCEGLPADLRDTAYAHMKACQAVCDRMKAGVTAIRTNKRLRESFRYSNSAMAIQHAWKIGSDGKRLAPLRWRPFQLGFILLAAESTCNPEANDRDVLDLLWFPTGGGKTEAYLAIIGMLAWYRRLGCTNPDDGAGNAAVMRYTLRLLTAQQFERASSLILACELIRKGVAAPRMGMHAIGGRPFSIGLWVGRDATPNKFAMALQSRGQRDVSSAEQMDHCPCCDHSVRWNYDEQAEKVSPHCENDACTLGPAFGLWPVYTVDQDIYREKPTLVIGTVDKFAQLPFKVEVAALFGFGTPSSTDLIIQDELHLISGPLGTLTGIYETAFDWLLRKGLNRPKVIGSTATIRRAESQVRALFDRRSCQFPPPGLSYDNSGFAVVDHDKPWRMYAGVTTAGRSAKFALQAVAGSLLQAGGPSTRFRPEERDGYATLLCYFNSLRELGGAIIQMVDDVPDSITLYAGRRGDPERTISLPRELTSRVSQKEIIEILSELKHGAGEPDCVDVVLATNMVSVGVDVPRLGLMIVNGQPKTRSEYIQSTSRVGRSAFPGLVISVLNAAKARDRSHYETYPSWHSKIYRDVEATSVTPFASRSRDRALRPILVSMIRHGDPIMSAKPNLAQAPGSLLADVVSEVERRIQAIDPRELAESKREIDEGLDDWDVRSPTTYLNRHKPNQSLLQYAEDHASRVAAGRLPGAAWPAMNTMRSVEPSSRFRLTEYLSSSATRLPSNNPPSADGTPQTDDKRPQPRWRSRNA